MSYPTMTAEVTRPEAWVAQITVEHDIAQSYSKAVQPRAMREARKVLRGTWALTDVDYPDGEEWQGRRCRTTYIFRHGVEAQS